MVSSTRRTTYNHVYTQHIVPNSHCNIQITRRNQRVLTNYISSSRILDKDRVRMTFFVFVSIIARFKVLTRTITIYYINTVVRLCPLPSNLC